MCSFTWKNKNVSLIREDSLILTKRKELNEISFYRVKETVKVVTFGKTVSSNYFAAG